MAARPSTSSTSGRVRETTHQEMAVGSFRRLEEIGRGSFATVYKASISKKPGHVAIKSVDLHKLNKKLKENLYSEIHILKGLHHPHIVALIDCQETVAHIHLIMEFCELGDLSYFIKKRDTLSLHDTTVDMIRKYPNPAAGGLNEVIVRHFLKQLASALEFLRAKNFIHRDVKPQNLLLDPSPQYYAKAKPEFIPYAAHERSLTPMVGVESLPTLKIADFGFARSLPSTSLAETLCGSPLYMAPEILRYEKYDAKADLWSVGTVLYEMVVGKPPFRASNHVELLRKIERGEDRIRFPEEVCMSDSIKKMIRGLLKRNPVERMGFPEFFNNTIVKDEIPGLTEEDRPSQLSNTESNSSRPSSSRSEEKLAEGATTRSSRPDTTSRLSQSPRKQLSNSPQTAALRAEPDLHRRSSGTPPRIAKDDLRDRRQSNSPAAEAARDHPSHGRRPSMVTHATAPARQDIYTRNAAANAVQRQSSRTSPVPQEKAQQRERPHSHKDERATREMREARERAAQDVAFERDYVLVEKRAVEVNAFADELAASPRIHGASQAQQDVQRGAMVRRSTTQGPLTGANGAQVTPSRAMQLASGKRPDQIHQRQGSYERRLRDPKSATSAISKAINMASGRLFGMGFSPPIALGRGGPSPPSYSPFPAYPTNQGGHLLLGDGSKTSAPLDEDTKAVLVIEESATRSDVVYGFAEVKYKQLVPLAPSMEHGLGLRQAGIPGEREPEISATEDEGLTVDATVTLSEEALVLYVKALSLLAKSMDIAGAWWTRKNRGEIVDDGSSSPRTPSTSATGVAIGNRVNNVVQWVRSRFNEVLEKAEFVRLKLLEAQKALPSDHPSNPINHPAASHSSTGMRTSADHVIVTSGVTAEKLMYDRALEMSRSAAVNELVGEDLPGCEIAYVTAIRMLEAVLEDDDEITPRRSGSASDKDVKREHSEESSINGVEAEDRKVVLKLVHSIRSRHAALRRKMEVISKTRLASAPTMAVSPSRTPVNISNPTTPVIGTTPPR